MALLKLLSLMHTLESLYVWHFYASLWYGRELVPTDWFVAKSYRATCWGLWQDGFPQGDTGDVWGDKLRPIAGGLE